MCMGSDTHVCLCSSVTCAFARAGLGVCTVTRRSVRIAVSVRGEVCAVGRVFRFLGDSSLPSALAAPASLRPHRPRPLDPGDLLSWWGRGGGLREPGGGTAGLGTGCWALGAGLRWGQGWGPPLSLRRGVVRVGYGWGLAGAGRSMAQAWLG